MTLLDAFLAIVAPWRAVFPQQRTYRPNGPVSGASGA